MIQQQVKDKEKKVRVGISHGDLNGVSYEIIIKALHDNRILELFTPVIYGLSKVLSYHRKNLNYNDFNYKVIPDASKAINKKINVVNLSNEEVKIEFGKSTEKAGQLSYQALERVVSDLKRKSIDVLVTAPINKSNIQSEQFSFPGHTEYLGKQFDCEDPVMLMVNNKIRIGTVSGHIPISQVANAVTKERIISKLNLLNQTLLRDFAIQKPKIAVLGLNPHAGDKGVIGIEDESIVHAAITHVRKQGILAYGPFPADGFFGSDEYTKYDAILAMYHDQGLIPFKLLAFEDGVNYTAGLPVIRTSPAHGTAYDIAGSNNASPESIRQAMYLAIDIFRNRMNYDEMNSNPLPSGKATHGATENDQR